MGKIIDITGQRFGRLTVLGMGKDKYSPSGKRIITWDCICDCGNRTNVTGGHIKSGHTWSCGCAHKEQMEAIGKFNLTHGKSRNREKEKSYQTWAYIKRRCYNPSDIDYPYYGAKGITLWEGWVNNPTDFCKYVEALERYGEKGTTIDRIDFTKNYEPGNLRWLSLEEQQRNKSSNLRITANGETHILQEWANITGIERRVISTRLKRGWTPEEAVNTPVLQGEKLYKKSPIKVERKRRKRQ